VRALNLIDPENLPCLKEILAGRLEQRARNGIAGVMH
jgi:hypothetical protein